MIRLIIGAFFAYALFINYSGSCATIDQIGCFKSTNTLLIAFLLYLLVGWLYFFKKKLHLFNHRQHYRVKQMIFGFVSILLLLIGVGILVLYGMNVAVK